MLEFSWIINFGMLVIMPLMSTVLSKITVNKVAITEKKTVTSTISKTLITWVIKSNVKLKTI